MSFGHSEPIRPLYWIITTHFMMVSRKIRTRLPAKPNQVGPFPTPLHSLSNSLT